MFSHGDITAGHARSSEKRVIAELFTATWCTYCPYADAALHELKAEYGERLVVLAYHPDSDDPFQNQDAVDRWTQYQNIARPQSLQWGYPTCIFDGNFSNAEVGGSSGTKSAYKTQIDSELQKSSLADIDAKADISGYPVVKIKASVTANVNLQTSNTINYKLNMVIFESGINYNASNGIKVHDYVVRDVLEPESLSLSQGSTITVERTFNFNTSWNINNCSAAVFIQNDISTPVIKNMNVGQATDIVPFVKGASMSITPESATVLAGNSIQYTLKISNFGKLNDNYTLSKSGEVSSWFSLPQLVTLAAGQSTTLTLNVNVPQGASEGVKTATISATSEINPNVVSKTTLNITVTPIPIYSAQLTPSSDTRKTISPGWANFTFTLKNTGNMPDNYTVSYSSSLNWQANLNPQQVTLNPSTSTQIYLNIRVPSEVSIGSYMFKINVKSEKNESMVLESTAYVQVEEIKRMVSITPKSSMVNITIGNSESITYTVTNLGNVEDTYSLSLVGDIYNWGLLSRSEILISAGNSGTFLLTISVPLTTTASSVSIKVRVVSQVDGTVTNESEILVVVKSAYTKQKISGVYIEPTSPNEKDYVKIYATITGDFTGQVTVTVVECLESGVCKLPITYNMELGLNNQYKSNIGKFAKGSHVSCNITVVGMDDTKVYSNYEFTVNAAPGKTNQTQSSGLCGTIVFALSMPFILIALAIYRRKNS